MGNEGTSAGTDQNTGEEGATPNSAENGSPTSENSGGTKSDVQKAFDAGLAKGRGGKESEVSQMAEENAQLKIRLEKLEDANRTDEDFRKKVEEYREQEKNWTNERKSFDERIERHNQLLKGDIEKRVERLPEGLQAPVKRFLEAGKVEDAFDLLADQENAAGTVQTPRTPNSGTVTLENDSPPLAELQEAIKTGNFEKQRELKKKYGVQRFLDAEKAMRSRT